MILTRILAQKQEVQCGVDYFHMVITLCQTLIKKSNN